MRFNSKPKIRESKSLDRAIKNQGEEKAVNKNLPQKNQSTLMKVDLEPGSSLKAKKDLLKNYDPWDTVFPKDHVSSA